MSPRKAVTWKQADFLGGLASPSLPPTSAPLANDVVPISAADLETFDLDELDDYIEEPQRAAAADPPVIVRIDHETADRYWVRLSRRNGGSVSSTLYYRSELQELLLRLQTTLETP